MRVDLVRAASLGDHEAFEALATSVGDRLYRTARLVLRNPEQAEDAVQETLTRAWQSLPSLREPERFDAWVYRLLMNACMDMSRRNRRWSTEIRLIDPDEQTSDASGWVADRDQLRRGFGRLRHEQRAVVVLHHYVGLPLREAAAVLGIPVGTAKSRLFYAMEVLRAALEADDRSTVASTEGQTA
jgi:RNA polymerase sigma factor (sigma-70 family)